MRKLYVLLAILAMLAGFAAPAQASIGWDRVQVGAPVYLDGKSPAAPLATGPVADDFKTRSKKAEKVVNWTLPVKGAGSGQARLLAGPYYHYNIGEDDTNSNATVPSGVAGNFTVEACSVDTADGAFHSLAQIAVREITSGTQYVELGWACNPAVFGDNNPHLFASKWENSAWCGSWTGSGSCGGAFVDVAGGVNIGDSLASAVGTAKAFKVQYFSNAWWVAYNNVNIGYFPKTGSGWPASFDQARLVQVFGEVAVNQDPITTDCTNMGSGVMGAGNPTPAGASIGSVTYFDASSAGLPTTDVNLNVYENSTYGAGWNPAALSTRTFRYGGPGAC